MAKWKPGIRWVLIGLLGITLPLVLAGCAGKAGGGSSKVAEEELVIPDFPDARTQFNFAKTYQANQLIMPDLDRRRVQMTKIAQCYHKVLQNFPNDPVYVPLSYFELGDCAAQSDDFAGAIGFYQRAQSVSQEEFVQARGTFSIARIYGLQGRHEEAKALYKSIMDRFSKSESGRVRDVVTRAAQQYYKVVDPSENQGSNRSR